MTWEHANGNHYDRIASVYAERYLNNSVDASLVERFTKKLAPEARIIDAGCGPGMHTNHLRQMGFEVVGIDTAPSMLAIARANFPHCEFVNGDIRALDISDDWADGVLCAYSLAHIPSTMFIETLRELARVLRPGGTLCIINQVGEPDHVEVEPLDASLQLTVNFFQEDSLRDHALAAGFEVSECETMIALGDAAMSEKKIYALATKPYGY